MNDDCTGTDDSIMNTNDEIACRDSSPLRKEHLFLPLRVKSLEDPEYGEEKPTKTATLSPVLLSPGSTTKKLIASGKIKNCFILLQKTSLDDKYLKAFTDRGESSLHDEKLTEQTKDALGLLSAEGTVECYEETGSEVANSPTCDVDEVKTKAATLDGGCDRRASSRNIFASFLREWPDVKIEGVTKEEKPQIEYPLSKVVEDGTRPELISPCRDVACQSVTSANADDQVTDWEISGGTRLLGDDAMSVSSTGSSETIEYPKCSEEDSQERFEIIEDDHCGRDDDHEVHPERDEKGVFENCDEPPRLESLESLHVPSHCLDHPPVLSPPLLMSFNDDTQNELTEHSGNLFFRAFRSAKASSNTPPTGDANQESSGVGVATVELPRKRSADVTELNGIKLPISQLESEPSKDGPHSIANEVLSNSLSNSKVQTEMKKDQSRTNSTEYEQSEQPQNDLKRVINDVFLSLSSSSTDTAFSSEQAPPRDSQDLAKASPPPKDQCVEAEYQEILHQIAQTGEDFAENDGSANDEALFSGDITLCGSAEDLRISEVVSLGEGFSVTAQEIHKKSCQNMDVTVDTAHCDSRTKEATDSILSYLDQSSIAYKLAQCADSSDGLSRNDVVETISQSMHSPLSDMNSETEIERAVASISESQQPAASRAEEDPGNMFDGRIEVAEIVIDPHADDSSSSTNEVGIMFSLNRATHDENGNLLSQYEIWGDESVNGQGYSDQGYGEDAQNSSIIPVHLDASLKDSAVSTTREGQESSTIKSSELNAEQTFKENGQVFPVGRGTTTGQRVIVTESPLTDSDSQTDTASSGQDEENTHESFDSSVNKQLVRVQQTRVSDARGPHTVSDASSRGHAHQETSQCNNLPKEKQNQSSYVSDGVYRDEETNSAEAIPPSQIVTQPTNQIRTSTTDNNKSGKGADCAVFPPSRSEEMDTAISLALMADMTTRSDAKEKGINQTTGVNALAVRQDNNKPGEVRTRHQSASRMSDSKRREGNLDSNSHAPQRPKSAHCVTSPGEEISVEALQRGNRQTNNTKSSRGRRYSRGRYSSGFTIVNYSNPTPPNPSQFDELKWRLMQEHRLHPHLDQQASIPQPANPQCLTDWSAVVAQQNGKFKSKGRPDAVSMQTGVPIEFPDGKRFLAYNKEALGYPATSFLADQPNGQTKAQNQYSSAPRNNGNDFSQFDSAVTTMASQQLQNAPKTVQLPQPNVITTIPGHSAHQQQMGSSYVHLNSFHIPPQMVGNVQAPSTTASSPTGVHNVYQQQPQAAGIHQSPISLNPDVHKMALKCKTYPPEQMIPVNRMDPGLGTTLYQNQSPTSLKVSEGQTDPSYARQFIPDNPGVMVVQKNGQLIPMQKSSGHGQAPRPALADNSSQSPNLPGAAGQPRSDGREATLTAQQTSAVNRRTSNFPKDPYITQQRLFIMARGSAAPPYLHKGGWPGHEVGHEVGKDTSPHLEQNEGGLQEHNGKPAANVVSVQHHQRYPVASGQRALSEFSASTYIGDLAETSRRHALNPSMHSERQLPFHLQRNQGVAERHEDAMSISTENVNKHTTSEHLRREINLDPNQIPLGNTQAVASVPRPTSQDLAPVMNIPASEPLSRTEALLNSLPKELANYLRQQRRQGVPIAKTVASILEEGGEEAEEARQDECQRGEMVGESTIHYRPPDAPPRNIMNAVNSITSKASTDPASAQRHNQATVTTLTTSPPRPTLRTTPQHCQMVDLSEMTNAANSQQNLCLGFEARQQLRQKSKTETQNCSTRNKFFFNPPPSGTPLLEANVVSPSTNLHESGSIQAQVEILNSPENSDSAIDLRTQTSQLDRDVDSYSEASPMYSQYSLSNSNLYHRAYTAGEPGPIRASSFVNLSLQATLQPVTLQPNLSQTQLLIRNRLLERRFRILSRSISTPDILHGYGYPNKRKQKGVVEASGQPEEVVPLPDSSVTQCHVSSDNSREFNDRNPPTSVPHSANKAFRSAEGANQQQNHCEDAVQNEEIIDNRESSLQSKTPVHYPKMKASLQNRWVTESVQPLAAPSTDTREKRLQPSGAIVTSNPEAVRDVFGLHSAREQSCSFHPTESTSARSVDQATRSEMGNAADQGAVKLPTLHTENVLDSTVQSGPGNLEKPGRPKMYIAPRKRKVDEASPVNTCPFCSFSSCYKSDVRSHVNREHFEKHIKVDNSASRRTTSNKSKFGNAAPEVESLREALPLSNHDRNIATSDAQPIHNRQTTAASTQSVPRTDGLVPPSSRCNDVQSHAQITLDLAEASNITVVASSPVFLQQKMTPAHRTGDVRPTETAALASQPLTPGSNTANPLPSAEQRATGELYCCQHCKLTFKNAKDKLIHVKFQHTNMKGVHMCFNCGYTSLSKSTLRKHILKWHTQGNTADKKFMCTHAKCDESFPTEDKLERHLRSHSVQRNFVCELCDAKYKNVTGLRYHQSRHKFNYPHQCKQCGLKFKSVGMLNRHQFQKKHVLT